MVFYSLDDKSPLLPEKGKFWVAPDANIIGDVILHENSSIWFGATIRGDMHCIRIGEKTNVQDNCTIHVTTNINISTVSLSLRVGHVVMHSQ